MPPLTRTCPLPYRHAPIQEHAPSIKDVAHKWRTYFFLQGYSPPHEGHAPTRRTCPLPEVHAPSHRDTPTPTKAYPFSQGHTYSQITHLLPKDMPHPKWYTSSQKETPPPTRTHPSHKDMLNLREKHLLLHQVHTPWHKDMPPPRMTCLLAEGDAPSHMDTPTSTRKLLQCHATQNWKCLLTSTHLLQWHTPT